MRKDEMPTTCAAVLVQIAPDGMHLLEKNLTRQLSSPMNHPIRPPLAPSLLSSYSLLLRFHTRLPSMLAERQAWKVTATTQQ